MIKKIMLAGASLFFCGSAFALDYGGLFVEPGITYEKSSGNINWPTPLSDSTEEIKGFGVSARVGFHLEQAFFLGLDGRYSIPRFKNSASNSTVDATAYNWGPVVGFQMPDLGLRVWADYVVDGQIDPKAYDAGGARLDGKFTKGKGYRIGAGFHVMAVSLNLEYQKLKYDRAELQELGPFNPGTSYSSVNLDDESWILGVSFPLTL